MSRTEWVISAITVAFTLKWISDRRSYKSKRKDETPKNIPEYILDEFNNRTKLFFGERLDNIQRAKILVVGLGGVGSNCVTTLIRSGVTNVTLVDFDKVTLSSLNRHGTAVWNSVGRSKVEVVADFLKSINPSVLTKCVETIFDASTCDNILSERFDYVVDAIDNVPSKALLLSECRKRGLKVIMAGGAASRSDATKIRVADISKTTDCQLSRAIRHLLRKKYGITSGIPVVYSTETVTDTQRKLRPLEPFQEDDPKNYQTLDSFRIRLLPVIAPIPIIMGNALASRVLLDLADCG